MQVVTISVVKWHLGRPISNCRECSNVISYGAQIFCGLAQAKELPYTIVEHVSTKTIERTVTEVLKIYHGRIPEWCNLPNYGDAKCR
jgi:hypothetical protein